jgi:hypothetical protein
LVNAAEIVIGVVDRNHVAIIFGTGLLWILQGLAHFIFKLTPVLLVIFSGSNLEPHLAVA